jgi:hypothetical protein
VAALFPQTFDATTLTIPLAALIVAVTSTELVPWPDVIVHPEGKLQV